MKCGKIYILVRITNADFTVSGIQRASVGENGARTDIFMTGNRHWRLPGTMVILRMHVFFAITDTTRDSARGILQEYESSSRVLFSF